VNALHSFGNAAAALLDEIVFGHSTRSGTSIRGRRFVHAGIWDAATYRLRAAARPEQGFLPQPDRARVVTLTSLSAHCAAPRFPRVGGGFWWDGAVWYARLTSSCPTTTPRR
jgi:hypothetical protein